MTNAATQEIAEQFGTSLNLGDVPQTDFLNVETGRSEPFVDGWYAATIDQSFTTTNKEGNEITLETSDVPSAAGDSRNIRLRFTVTRKSDGRVSHQGTNVNYRPDVDFTQERLATIALGKTQKLTSDETRSQLAVSAIKELSKIAGASLRRTSEGSFDLTPLFGKTAYVRWADVKQRDGSMRKGIADFAAEAPKKGTL